MSLDSLGVPVSLRVTSAGPTCKAGVKESSSARKTYERHTKDIRQTIAFSFYLLLLFAWKLEGYGMRNAIGALAREIGRLRSGGEAGPGAEPEVGEWELIEEQQFFPGAPPSFNATIKFQAEEGPPEIPACVLAWAQKKLRSSKEPTIKRAEAAFSAGYWFRVGQLCEVELTSSYNPVLAPSTWLIQKDQGVSNLVRASTRKEADLLCSSIPGARIIEKFPSVTELQIFCAGAQVPNLLALGGEQVNTFALPLISRQGGMLLAFPGGVIDDDAFPSSAAEEDQMVGPCKMLDGIELYEEDDTEGGALQAVQCGLACSAVVCDFLDTVLQYLREYDPITDSTLEVVPFDETRPAAIPLHAEVLRPALEWARSELEGRVLFYSAREEPDAAKTPPPRTPKKAAAKRISNAILAEKVSTLTAQMQVLMKQQASAQPGPSPINPGPTSLANHAAEPRASYPGFHMPPVSQQLASPARLGTAKMTLVSPPPKVRAPAPQIPMPPEEPYNILDDGLHQDATVAALSQQSAALTALVSHLINQEGGIDLGAMSTSTSSTKGTMKREKMQQDLAGRRSSFFMQIQQQIFKKLHPSRLLPKTEDELSQSQLSLLTYLERYGGYKGQKEAGLCMWILAHAMDAAASNDFYATKEFLALAVMGLEQSVFDAGDWSLAYVLTLAEDPPSTMFVERMSSLTAASRPFSPLVPPSLASTNLSYIKELEVLSTRRIETRPKKGQPGSPSAAAKAQGADEENPSPRKPKGPRFPKKPKAIADA
eukprot:s317_g7.t1